MRRLPKRSPAPTDDRAEKSTPTPDAVGDRRVRLLVEDVDSGEQTAITGAIPWRAIEVLGSAAHFYAADYSNPDRPYDQVRRRRDWAAYLGASLWDLAEAQVGIQTVTVNDLPPAPT